jgi:hypothetical protein
MADAPKRLSVQETIAKEVVRIGEKSTDPFPMLDRIWDIYVGKGIRTVFLSVGASASVLPDLEISESLGCPLNVVALNESETAGWAEISTILKDRKREASASAFSEGAESKWILPKNIRVQPALPWWENGSVDLSGGSTVRTQNVGDLVKSICVAMKLKEAGSRLDILKVDTTTSCPGLERSVVGAVLSAGFRPSILLVRWSQMPDVDLSTTIAAGHLQNCGYSLVGKLDNKFLYYFTDEDMYQICSWEKLSINNPITTEIVRAARNPTQQKSLK